MLGFIFASLRVHSNRLVEPEPDRPIRACTELVQRLFRRFWNLSERNPGILFLGLPQSCSRG
jgi:hypothetical protein